MEYAGNRIEGWMGDEELAYLYSQATQMKQVVEIVSWLGRSSHALLSGCKGNVYCIDHFIGSPEDETKDLAKTRNIHREFFKNVGMFPNLTCMKMESLDAVRFFSDKSIDMIFIDGGHDEKSFRADVYAWLPKCRKLFCGHDFNHPGVQKVVETIFFNEYKVPSGNIWAVKI